MNTAAVRNYTSIMTTLRRILGISLILASAIVFPGCKHHYKGYCKNYWRIPSHAARSNSNQNSNNATQPQYRPAAPDPFYAEQAAKREANMRAARQISYDHQMDAYKRGYTNKLPN